MDTHIPLQRQTGLLPLLMPCMGHAVHCKGCSPYSVVVEVDFLHVAVDGAGQDAGETLDWWVILRAVNLSNVHQGGDGLHGGWRAPDHMEATWQQP